ncbi:MAG TPA: universal stress protein [Longimicrobium sp.]|nr:universal stress protein [Longimicrobium sp.]
MRPPLRRLVAGVATPSRDDPALVAALRLAARAGAELHLVHVTPPEAVPGVLRVVEEALRGSAAAVAPGSRDSGRVVFRIASGAPDRCLLEAVEETGADLLVLGATRRGALAGALLGTTAGRVLRGARVPVLVAHGPLPERPLRVLLTTDLSTHAAHAHARGGALARALAAEGEAETRSLYVEPPVLVDLPYAEAASELRAAGELADFLRAEVPPAPDEPRVRVGDPATEIVREAREWGADLLVMGTHGRRGAPRLFLGSVAETVLLHAPCATLVVPPLRPYRMEADHAATEARALAGVG